jgi:uncharacterized protein YjeT (DUF2065 family)
MNDILTALGLVLVIEGIFYAMAPERAKKLMALASEAPPDTLRAGGLIAVSVGVAVVWLAKSVFLPSS